MGHHFQTADLMQYLLSGVALGSIYAMVAIGFNIIYNATGIVNLAQGEFVMLGGMVTVWAHNRLSLPVAAAVLVAVVSVALIGIAFERLAIRPVRKPTVLTLVIITIAGSFVFRGAALLVWGRSLSWMEPFLGEAPVHLLGARITRQHILVFFTLIVVAFALMFFFGYTIAGKSMRACSYNRTAARLVGINDRTMVMLAFALSAGIGALAGAVVVPISYMEYDNGAMFGLKGFAAAVFGGLGHNPAAVVAGILLGIIESLSAGFISSDYKDAIALGVLLLVLFVRPRGLFGRTDLGRLTEF
ncbi:branched-chain amino acid ABC transporter permease [Candidatus Sumerlaeota bacterium]|nr:branched-chain amino acid ABC transporter permease [Candidatus Sumerlaeota bacterium]